MGARSKEFRSDHYLHDISKYGFETSGVNGPFFFLNPTHAELKEIERSSHDPLSTAPYPLVLWTSRNNRKGRHQLLLTTPPHDPVQAPSQTNSFRHILRGLLRMVTYFPIWDVSYDVASFFTAGSLIWVLTSIFTFHPLAAPETEFKDEALYAGRIPAFVGATFFVMGSFFMLLEAVNDDREWCFGWTIKRALEVDEEHGTIDSWKLVADEDSCKHCHANREGLCGRTPGDPSHGPAQEIAEGAKNKLDKYPSFLEDAKPQQRSRTWLPTIHQLRNHYIYELGFIASLIQTLASAIFYISSFTGLPGIFEHLTAHLVNGVRFVPQFIGGVGFIIAGSLFMIETQTKWYQPNPKVLGWHSGAWNLVGGIGFTLSPVFGVYSVSWAQYQSALSTLWGSSAFFIGSAIQLFESLEKYPVEEKT